MSEDFFVHYCRLGELAPQSIRNKKIEQMGKKTETENIHRCQERFFSFGFFVCIEK